MPWYFISYHSSSGKLVKGYKEFHFKNVDDAFVYYLGKARMVDPGLTGFNCVMVSTKSEEWQEWNRNRYKTRYGYRPEEHRSGPGKYRARKEE